MSTPALHRRTLGWVGTAALAMGGSNQSLFLIGALFAGQEAISGPGQRRRSAAHRRRAAELGGAARLDRARPALTQPRRRHRRGVHRGVRAVQHAAVGAGRLLLLVGMGSDLRPDRAAVRFGLALLARSVDSDNLARHRDHRRVRHDQPVRRRVGCPRGDPDRRRFGDPLVPGCVRTDRDRPRRLASRDDVSSDDTIPRLVRRPDLAHGRPLPDRLCRAGIRGRRVSRRRDDRSATERAARDVRERGNGRRVLHRAARRLAGCPRTGSPRPRLGDGARAGVRTAVRIARQSDGGRIHGLQHVSRNVATTRRRVAHPFATRGRRRVSAFPRAALEERRTVGRDGRHRRRRGRFPVDRRSDLADRGGELHLFDRDLSAERRRLAVAPRRAGRERACIARRAVQSRSASARRRAGPSRQSSGSSSSASRRSSSVCCSPIRAQRCMPGESSKTGRRADPPAFSARSISG